MKNGESFGVASLPNAPNPLAGLNAEVDVCKFPNAPVVGAGAELLKAESGWVVGGGLSFEAAGEGVLLRLVNSGEEAGEAGVTVVFVGVVGLALLVLAGAASDRTPNAEPPTNGPAAAGAVLVPPKLVAPPTAKALKAPPPVAGAGGEVALPPLPKLEAPPPENPANPPVVAAGTDGEDVALSPPNVEVPLPLKAPNPPDAGLPPKLVWPKAGCFPATPRVVCPKEDCPKAGFPNAEGEAGGLICCSPVLFPNEKALEPPNALEPPPPKALPPLNAEDPPPPKPPVPTAPNAPDPALIRPPLPPPKGVTGVVEAVVGVDDPNIPPPTRLLSKLASLLLEPSERPPNPEEEVESSMFTDGTVARTGGAAGGEGVLLGLAPNPNPAPPNTLGEEEFAKLLNAPGDVEDPGEGDGEPKAEP